MKRGNKVRVIPCDTTSLFIGKVGTITKVYPKAEWDDEDVPEYEIDLGDIMDENGISVDGSHLWFTANELEMA